MPYHYYHRRTKKGREKMFHVKLQKIGTGSHIWVITISGMSLNIALKKSWAF